MGKSRIGALAVTGTMIVAAALLTLSTTAASAATTAASAPSHVTAPSAAVHQAAHPWTVTATSSGADPWEFENANNLWICSGGTHEMQLGAAGHLVRWMNIRSILSPEPALAIT
jgi:hypothetical protein